MPDTPPWRAEDEDDGFAIERALAELVVVVVVAGMKASVESTSREVKVGRRIFMILTLCFSAKQN